MSKSDTLPQRPDHTTGFHNNKDVVLIKLEFFTVQALEDVVVEGEEKTFYANFATGSSCLLN